MVLVAGQVVGTKSQAMRSKADKDQGKFNKLTEYRCVRPAPPHTPLLSWLGSDRLSRGLVRLVCRDKYKRNVEALRPLAALRAKERTLQQLVDKEEQQVLARLAPRALLCV